MADEEILRALTQELEDHLFDATYGDPHMGGPQIKVKSNECQTYFVRIVDNKFQILCHNGMMAGSKIEREIPLEHPFAVNAVLRILDRKCEFGRVRRRNAFSL